MGSRAPWWFFARELESAHGRWRTFKDGGRRVVVFASVVEDMERREAEGSGKPIEPVAKRRPGRPRKPCPEDQTSQAG